jgi:3-hydroxyacyl-CoA dehydrogenase/3-hydroxy-2-methylbutyryl-CoA dehydrogenase
LELKNKVAIVTGGASGLGQTAVERFVKAGARVGILDLDAVAGEALALRLGEACRFYPVDVTDERAVQDAIDDMASTFDALHICCNFAGIASACKTVGRSGAFPLDVFERVIKVNLVGSFNVLRLAAARMAENDPVTEDGGRGVIINIASVAAYEGQMGQAAYSASKGGIVAMTLPIARDLAGLGIRVNTIAPGLMATPLMLGMGEKVVQALGEMVNYPRRLGHTDEVAHVAQCIVENEYINGEVIRVDGGLRMQAK